MNTQVNDKLVNQTKYDGKPFLPYEIEEKGLEIAKELKELVYWLHLKILEIM